MVDLERDGEPGRDGELDVQGLRARLTSLPDTERTLEGRATGSGGLVSGTPMDVCCESGLGASSLSNSSGDTSRRETVMAGWSLPFERREVRRKMSFPAATSSFVGDGDWLGNVKSENVLRRGGETGVVMPISGRCW